MELKREFTKYYDKNGVEKVASNYYVEIETIGIKVQLKPNDFTGREILDKMFNNIESKRG